jgi:hypothetical protein
MLCMLSAFSERSLVPCVQADYELNPYRYTHLHIYACLIHHYAMAVMFAIARLLGCRHVWTLPPLQEERRTGTLPNWPEHRECCIPRASP